MILHFSPPHLFFILKLVYFFKNFLETDMTQSHRLWQERKYIHVQALVQILVNKNQLIK